MNLPDFTKDGVLPPGDYTLSIEELRVSILVTGPADPARAREQMWDSAWRRKLVDNLEILAMQLRGVGISDLFVNGSFVEDKSHPNDIDGYFVCDRGYLSSGDLQRDLNARDPHKVWTWDPNSRRPYPGSPKRQLPMWHQYRVELYPHFGQMSGIRDRYDNELEFPSAFRISRRTDSPKGIIKLGGMR